MTGAGSMKPANLTFPKNKEAETKKNKKNTKDLNILLIFYHLF